MDAEIKTQWIAALRSGTYKQGTGALKDPGTMRFCCLGVLCDVLDPFSWDGRHQKVHGGEGLLPAHIATSQGISSDEQWELARLNDGGRSFLEIADHIEEHL